MKRKQKENPHKNSCLWLKIGILFALEILRENADANADDDDDDDVLFLIFPSFLIWLLFFIWTIGKKDPLKGLS